MSPVSKKSGKPADPSGGSSPTRGRKLKWAAALLGLFVLCVLADGLLIEPYWIEVTHYDIQASVAAPLKIAHLTDLHTRGLGPRERQMLRILDREKPDIILIIGDTVATRAGNYRECKEVYDQLHAPLGVWFVHGNWENSTKPVRAENAYYQDAGVHFLLNGNAAARPDVWLIGLDDPYSGTAKLDTALAGVPANTYTIALFHSPAFFDRIAGRVNLCLAGHTHGGQVRLPFLKPLWLPRGCGRFVEGWYQEQGSQMYVSRGLGTSILPVRFFCRPEIAFITIHP
jgi:predicted MPP superfamily phosphohydrolase